jgi:transcription-repair coupling factor (superfamily II helicase)
VGRSASRAYAYLLYPRFMPVSGVARKRLDAISEAGELGAGFRIAMRDLEIRGAGELLGARQHGHISAIGFDLYCRLLAQAVREVKGEAPRRVLDEVTAYIQPLESTVQISLPLAAYLPDSYIPEDEVRLELYRRFAGLTTLEGIESLEAELVDRFGALPEAVSNLFYQVRVKVLGLQAGVQAVAQEDEQLVVRADSLASMDRTELQRRLKGTARVSVRQVWLQIDPAADWRKNLVCVLTEMGDLRATESEAVSRATQPERAAGGQRGAGSSPDSPAV